MSATTFTLDDLMALLSEKAGLPADARTTDRDARFSDIGLDSLAFLSMQTALQDRYGAEMPEENPELYTFGEIVDTVNAAVTDRAGMA
ncbi:minimal PKS acyl carrier protein [Geodermatophilus telluris]|uniref:Minimal PKS acyl carrier protein n=1 Tax=Geodermatophilus telluris TaxID=1190417 RepID=A0A1G6UII1_9ACTN|nr:acyl carrier protein [Geodermatophilus telluris]SDD41069.1 minimal PKS acyl carrier protein [Geodermatophilus telluris]